MKTLTAWILRGGIVLAMAICSWGVYTSGKEWVQWGLLILILTPVIRVLGMSLFFALKKDSLYATLSLILFLILTYSLVGCQRTPLECRLEALTPNYLASTKVGNTDPLKKCFCGQQLVVTWQLPGRCAGDLFLRLSYITGKHTLETITARVEGSSSAYVYRLIGKNYRIREGILTYKAELFSHHHLLATYKPRSWVDWIAEDESEE